MRQRFQNDEQTQPQPMTYRVPQAAEATVATTATVPLRQQRERRTARKTSALPRQKRLRLSVRGALLGILAFLFIPWCPPTTPTTVTPTVTGPSANALYAGIGALYHRPLIDGSLSRLTPAERIQRDAELGIVPKGQVSTPLPPLYEKLTDFKSQEALQAHVQQNQAALAELRKGLALPYYKPGMVSMNGIDYKHYVSPFDLMRLTTRTGVMHALNGDTLAAAMAYLDGLALAIQLQPEYPGFTLHVAKSVSEGLEACVTQLTRQEAAQVAARLEALYAKRYNFTAILEGIYPDPKELRLERYRVGGEKEWGGRVPLLRALDNYTLSQEQRIAESNLALVRKGEQGLAGKFREAGKTSEDAFFTNRTNDRYAVYQANNQRVVQLLERLKARAEGKS